MAARKRIRPPRSKSGGVQREQAQREAAAARRRAAGKEAGLMAGFLTLTEAAAVTGTSRFSMSRLIKREGIETYEAPTDRRQRMVKEEDVARLMAPRPRPARESGTGAGGAGAAE